MAAESATLALAHGAHARGGHLQSVGQDVESLGWLEMKKSEAADIFRSLLREGADRSEEVGVRDGNAYLRVTANGRWAVAFTPGERWFAVETDLGYSWSRFDEDATQSDISRTIAFCVEVARAYADGRYEKKISRLLRIPELAISTEEGVAVLTLAMTDMIRHVLGGVVQGSGRN